MALRLELPTVLVACAVVGAAAFAVGRSTSPRPSAPAHEPDLPRGHPAVAPASAAAAAPPASAMTSHAVELAWTTPPRWETVASASAMRIATYRIPRAPGDPEDAELSVMQAGGSLEANIERWCDQFGESGKKTLKRRQERLGGLDVTMVEIEGTFSGGMGKDAHPIPNAALLGAIVPTPGSAHFFKMTGPIRTVQAAREELQALVTSLTLK